MRSTRKPSQTSTTYAITLQSAGTTPASEAEPFSRPGARAGRCGPSPANPPPPAASPPGLRKARPKSLHYLRCDTACIPPWRDTLGSWPARGDHYAGSNAVGIGFDGARPRHRGIGRAAQLDQRGVHHIIALLVLGFGADIVGRYSVEGHTLNLDVQLLIRLLLV